MNTKKLNDLAHTIVNYSLKLKENSKVQVTFTVEATPLVEELIKEARKWEIAHGGMSGRAAQQLINHLAGKAQ